MNEILKFEEQDVKIIVENGELLFEIYSTGMALGQVKKNSVGKEYPFKERIDKNLENAEIEPCVRNVHKYITESQLYDLMLEMKTDKVKPFRKWVTNEVLPTIRKTGGYVNNVDLMVNTYFGGVSDEHKVLVKGLLTNIEEQQKKIITLSNENDLLAQKNLEWADRPLINSLIRVYATSIGNDYAKAWNNFKKELLYKFSINLNSRITNHLNNSGKKTKPKTLDMLDNSELASAISVAVSLCKENDLDISNLIYNKAS